MREEGEEEKEGRRERHEVNWKYKKSIQKDIYMETNTISANNRIKLISS